MVAEVAFHSHKPLTGDYWKLWPEIVMRHQRSPPRSAGSGKLIIIVLKLQLWKGKSN